MAAVFTMRVDRLFVTITQPSVVMCIKRSEFMRRLSTMRMTLARTVDGAFDARNQDKRQEKGL